MNYREKYLKYKIKYLSLKNKQSIDYFTSNTSQHGGYPHSLYLISHLKKGFFRRDLYGDWAFMNGLRVRDKSKGLMLDLHNVTDTLWDHDDSQKNKVRILSNFIETTIQKYELEKLVICSWVGNINGSTGQSVVDLLTQTFESLNHEIKERFIGIGVDTKGKSKKNYYVRNKMASESGPDSINEKTSPKPHLADSLNLSFLIDDSVAHLPDKYHNVDGVFFDLRKSIDKSRIADRKIINYFDERKFHESNYDKKQALVRFLESLYNSESKVNQEAKSKSRVLRDE